MGDTIGSNPTSTETLLINKPKLTRVEIIGTNGREFSKWLKLGYYEVSIQDDGKTIKLFEKQG